MIIMMSCNCTQEGVSKDADESDAGSDEEEDESDEESDVEEDDSDEEEDRVGDGEEGSDDEEEEEEDDNDQAEVEEDENDISDEGKILLINGTKYFICLSSVMCCVSLPVFDTVGIEGRILRVVI